MVGMSPCADVRVNEDDRLRVNMRKLLEYGFPESSAWHSLGWFQQTIETITEKIATWSIKRQWRESKDLAKLFCFSDTKYKNFDTPKETSGNSSDFDLWSADKTEETCTANVMREECKTNQQNEMLRNSHVASPENDIYVV